MSNQKTISDQPEVLNGIIEVCRLERGEKLGQDCATPLRRSTRTRKNPLRLGFPTGEDTNARSDRPLTETETVLQELPHQLQMLSPPQKDIALTMTLDKARKLTNLRMYSLRDLLDNFSTTNGPHLALISRPTYNEFMRGLTQSGAELEPNEKQMVDDLVDQIFEDLARQYDYDNPTQVETKNLFAGLSSLCGGTRDEKVEECFRLFAQHNGSGEPTLNEELFISYLTSIFKVLYIAKPKTGDRMGISPEELAIVTAEHALFNTDGKEMTLEAFQAWYS